MSIRLACLVSAALLTVACGAAQDSSENVGEARAQLTRVPSDVACIDISVAGASTVHRRFDVTAGASTNFALRSLPTGNVTFTAFAYPTPCAQVAADANPSWLSDPTPAVVSNTGAPVNVSLSMRKSGQAGVAVDFPEDGPPPVCAADQRTCAPCPGDTAFDCILRCNSARTGWEVEAQCGYGQPESCAYSAPVPHCL
jgi:hypothetical protein